MSEESQPRAGTGRAQQFTENFPFRTKPRHSNAIGGLHCVTWEKKKTFHGPTNASLWVRAGVRILHILRASWVFQKRMAALTEHS